MIKILINLNILPVVMWHKDRTGDIRFFAFLCSQCRKRRFPRLSHWWNKRHNRHKRSAFEKGKHNWSWHSSHTYREYTSTHCSCTVCQVSQSSLVWHHTNSILWDNTNHSASAIIAFHSGEPFVFGNGPNSLAPRGDKPSAMRIHTESELPLMFFFLFHMTYIQISDEWHIWARCPFVHRCSERLFLASHTAW